MDHRVSRHDQGSRVWVVAVGGVPVDIWSDAEAAGTGDAATTALRANYDDGYFTVGEHLDCFATEHNRRDAAAAVGGHHNCVASSLSGRIDNRLVGMLVFNLYHIAGHAGGRSRIRGNLEIFRRQSGYTFFVLVRRVRDHARLRRENMERLRDSYRGDLSVESFC